MIKLNSMSIGAIFGGVFAITVLLLGSTMCVVIVIMKTVVKEGTNCMHVYSHVDCLVTPVKLDNLLLHAGSIKPCSLRTDLRYICMVYKSNK